MPCQGHSSIGQRHMRGQHVIIQAVVHRIHYRSQQAVRRRPPAVARGSGLRRVCIVRHRRRRFHRHAAGHVGNIGHIIQQRGRCRRRHKQALRRCIIAPDRARCVGRRRYGRMPRMLGRNSRGGVRLTEHRIQTPIQQVLKGKGAMQEIGRHEAQRRGNFRRAVRGGKADRPSLPEMGIGAEQPAQLADLPGAGLLAASAVQQFHQQQTGFQMFGMPRQAVLEHGNGLILLPDPEMEPGQRQKDLGIGFQLQNFPVPVNFFRCHRPPRCQRP